MFSDADANNMSVVQITTLKPLTDAQITEQYFVSDHSFLISKAQKYPQVLGQIIHMKGKCLKIHVSAVTLFNNSFTERKMKKILNDLQYWRKTLLKDATV